MSLHLLPRRSRERFSMILITATRYELRRCHLTESARSPAPAPPRCSITASFAWSGKRADALRKVLVAVRILRQQTRPRPRQHAGTLQRVIQRLQCRHLHARELEQQEPAARLQNPPRLAQHRQLCRTRCTSPEARSTRVPRSDPAAAACSASRDQQRHRRPTALRSSARSRATRSMRDVDVRQQPRGPPPFASQPKVISPVPPARSKQRVARARRCQRR